MQTLLANVEKGLIDLDDPALAERLHTHKANRTRLNDEIALAARTADQGNLTITPAKLERLSGAMREALKAGRIDLSRAYVRMFVNRVVVSRREVRISGPRKALAKAGSSGL